MQQGRGQWGSNIGFVLAASGSAIGLGNIWRFPYITGESGGAAFVVLYLACVMLICLPYLFAELALGRSNHLNPVGAIEAIRGKNNWWYDNHDVHSSSALGPFCGQQEDRFAVFFEMDVTFKPSGEAGRIVQSGSHRLARGPPRYPFPSPAAGARPDAPSER